MRTIFWYYSWEMTNAEGKRLNYGVLFTRYESE